MFGEENLEHLIHVLATLEKLDDVKVLVELLLALLEKEVSAGTFATPPFFPVFIFVLITAAESELEVVFERVLDRILKVAPVHD